MYFEVEYFRPYVLVNIPIGRSGVVAVLWNIRIFEYPNTPHTKEGVSCEIRSSATLPPVAHLAIGQFPPSRTLPPSRKAFRTKTPAGQLLQALEIIPLVCLWHVVAR